MYEVFRVGLSDSYRACRNIVFYRTGTRLRA
jgi:hypothetical protein